MDIELLLEDLGGVADRTTLVARVGRARVDAAVRSGRIVILFPRAYALPWVVDEPLVRRRAALLSVGGENALSHTTSLQGHGLLVPGDHPIHVTAYQARHPRGVPDEVVVHRTLRPLDAVERDGLPVTRIESALVDSWPMLFGTDRRAPAILAAQRKLITPGRFARAVESMWWIKDRKELIELAGLLLAGCRSQLEIWGYLDVFNVPGLDDASRQRPLRLADRTVLLDMAYEEEKLAVELDGRQYHSSPEQWEKDTERDLAVATRGWQTIRLSHRRLHTEADGCRRDVLAVRNERRVQFGLGRLAA